VDADDLAHFILCATGPGIAQEQPDCVDARLDGDDDVDADDFAILQRCLTLDGVALNMACAQ
jgi:hypothetical protein